MKRLLDRPDPRPAGQSVSAPPVSRSSSRR
jgi:hypothetical protein